MAEVKRGTSAVFRVRWTFHKDYELLKVQALSADIPELDTLSLNYWVSKFVLMIWARFLESRLT